MTIELVVVVLLVAVLVGLAIYFTSRQIQSIRALRSGKVAPEYQKYIHWQITRRLACSVLMVLLAGMLVASYYIEAGVRAQVEGAGKQQAQEAAQTFAIYWGAFLIVLFILLWLAATDIIANARFGFRQSRRIASDRQDMIEQYAAQLRRERNGK